MVPYESTSAGWYCVVVMGDETYPVGGYNLFVSHIEINTAEEMTIDGRTDGS